MKMLSESHDPKMQAILALDYKALGLDMPIRGQDSPTFTTPDPESNPRQAVGADKGERSASYCNLTVTPSTGLSIQDMIKNLLGVDAKIVLHGVDIVYQDDFTEEMEESTEGLGNLESRKGADIESRDGE